MEVILWIPKIKIPSLIWFCAHRWENQVQCWPPSESSPLFPRQQVFLFFTYFPRNSKHHIVESLQSHMILTMSHCSSGLTCLLPATRVTGSNPLGGLMWNRDSPVSIVSLHWWPWRNWSSTGLRPKQLSLGPRADNVTVPLDFTQLFCPGFTLAAGHNRRSQLLWGSPMESLQSHLILTMSYWSTLQINSREIYMSSSARARPQSNWRGNFRDIFSLPSR